MPLWSKLTRHLILETINISWVIKLIFFAADNVGTYIDVEYTKTTRMLFSYFQTFFVVNTVEWRWYIAVSSDYYIKVCKNITRNDAKCEL